MQNVKIYFAGSIRGGREDSPLYRHIIRELKKYGEVLTEHVGDDRLMETGESQMTDRDIHDRDMAWIKSADIMIAEVSTPSLGVGYEIASALHLGKKLYCLFNLNRGNNLSAMIRGSKHVNVYDYTSIHDIKNFLPEIFERH